MEYFVLTVCFLSGFTLNTGATVAACSWDAESIGSMTAFPCATTPPFVTAESTAEYYYFVPGRPETVSWESFTWTVSNPTFRKVASHVQIQWQSSDVGPGKGTPTVSTLPSWTHVISTSDNTTGQWAGLVALIIAISVVGGLCSIACCVFCCCCRGARTKRREAERTAAATVRENRDVEQADLPVEIAEDIMLEDRAGTPVDPPPPYQEVQPKAPMELPASYAYELGSVGGTTQPAQNSSQTPQSNR
jgi:hypothetical protein